MHIRRRNPSFFIHFNRGRGLGVKLILKNFRFCAPSFELFVPIYRSEKMSTSLKAIHEKRSSMISSEKPRSAKKPQAPKPSSQDKVTVIRLAGWLTEHEAAALRTKLYPSTNGASVSSQTIGKWRRRGYVGAVNFSGRIWLVSEYDIRNMPKVPEGNPARINRHDADVWRAWCEQRKEFEKNRPRLEISLQMEQLQDLDGWFHSPNA